MRVYGGIPLCLLLLLTACSSEPVIEYRDRPVPVEVVKFRLPPVDAALLRPCPPVERRITTNGELLDAFLEANTRLTQCSADKDELRGLLDGK